MHSTCALTNLDLAYIFANVDSMLYKSYDANDLRKIIFFTSNPDGSHYFTGSYEGTYVNYNGIATDEMYLIRAECYARSGKIVLAMNDLNALLVNRFKKGTFIPLHAGNDDDALNLILNERRKELIFRMLRFTDIKRLNKEGANITQKRIINGVAHTLSPNDPYYALPIPENVIQYTGMKQN